MNLYIKSIIFIFSLLFLVFIQTGCMEKQSNGKYVSKYSFHPYYDMYPSKMSGSKRQYRANKSTYRRASTPYHKVTYNDDERYPSNVPANNY